MHIARLRKVCKYWQGRLRLNDWKITVRFVPQKHIPDNCAHVQYAAEYKEAEVVVVKARDREWGEGQNHEVVMCEDVVHELLHVLVEGSLEDDGRYRPEVEFAINVIAGLLMEGVVDEEGALRI